MVDEHVLSEAEGCRSNGSQEHMSTNATYAGEFAITP